MSRLKPTMDPGRWRHVSTRVWRDADFRELSPIPPCGQGLWLYLLTTPFTTSIPGLYPAREEALAADLGWPLQAFREAFGEAFRKGWVEADWKAGLVWVRKALRHDPPASPNVVRSWASVARNELPECPLRQRALAGIYTEMQGIFASPGPWLEAMREAVPGVDAFGEGFPQALPESRLQTPDTGVVPAERAERAPRPRKTTRKAPAEQPPADPRHAPLVKALADTYERVFGTRYPFAKGRDAANVRELLALADPEVIVAAWERALRHQGYPTVRTLTELRAHLAHFTAPARAGSPRAGGAAGIQPAAHPAAVGEVPNAF